MHIKLSDKNWLMDQLKTKSTKEISNELGCKISSVQYACKKHEINLTNKNHCTDDRYNDSKWLEEHVTTIGVTATSKIIGISPAAIRQRCNKLNIKLPKRRDIQTPIRTYLNDENQLRYDIEVDGVTLTEM